jgi:hypothetical protein
VYCQPPTWLAQWVWRLCGGQTGFVRLNRWQTQWALCLLQQFTPADMAAKPMGKSHKPVGFFWYPVAHVSPAMLSYGVHHWQVALQGGGSEFERWHAALLDPLKAQQHLNALSLPQLDSLGIALQQEQDALSAQHYALKHLPFYL